MSDRPDYVIPDVDADVRAKLLSRYRRLRATWLHDVLGRVPTEDQPDALYAVLEHERCETEALMQLAESWRATVQAAYRTGIVHGGEDMGRTLGLIPDPPTETPLTRH